MVMDREPGAGSLTATSMPAGPQAQGVGKQTLVGAAPQPTAAHGQPSRAGGAAAAPASAQVQPAADSVSASSPPIVAPPSGRGRLGELLATPAAPLGDPAVLYLLGLPLPAQLDELSEAVECGYALPLEARLAAAPPILAAALQAAELARYKSLHPGDPALDRAGAALDRVALDQQVGILSWLLGRRGVSMAATSLVEGAIAIREGEPGADGSGGAADVDGAATGGAARAGAAVGAQLGKGGSAPSPIEKGGWDPPGDQPAPLYVGTEVHRAIGAHYRLAHPGENVTTNDTSVLALLRRFEELAKKPMSTSALSEHEGLLRPDILNLDLRHLYEIKPEAARAEGRAKVEMYKSALGKGGMQVTLGPVNDPGVTGATPAPDGTVMFECVEPGLITYRYRHSRMVPVPVPVPAPAEKRSREWKWAFENDLTPEQRSAMVTTTVGGAVLILLMVVLAPVGA